MQRAGRHHSVRRKPAAAPGGVPDAAGNLVPDRAAALAQYRQRASTYDNELALFEPIRTDAIAALGLRHGDTVLDIACGTGLSFESLRRAVGPRGRVVGVEQSPDMMARARERVARHHWRNVDLLCAPALVAPIGVRADAALFHFTHDVLREEAALDHVFAQLKPGARVVASGLQWAAPWMWPTNAFVMAAALYSVTSLEGLGRPWDKLARRLHQVQVRTALMGGIYIASGVYDGEPHTLS